ncbi:MAG TPA: hypothetical protein VGF94_08485 [Kofleriaceae bacterium]|jgi:hypothetical protein
METLKPDKPANQKPDSDGIPVLELRFDTGYRDPDLGLDGSGGGRGILRASKRVSITYLPARQFYRIVEQAAKPTDSPNVWYVPREWAAFQPLDGQKLD